GIEQIVGVHHLREIVELPVLVDPGASEGEKVIVTNVLILRVQGDVRNGIAWPALANAGRVGGRPDAIGAERQRMIPPILLPGHPPVGCCLVTDSPKGCGAVQRPWSARRPVGESGLRRSV